MYTLDSHSFNKYTKMTPKFLARAEPCLVKRGCNFREPPSAGRKLAIALSHLANMVSKSLFYQFMVGRCTISNFVPYRFAKSSSKRLTPHTTEGTGKGIQDRWNVPESLLGPRWIAL